MSRFSQFRRELFRRRVVRVVVAYLAIFWAIMAGLSQFQDGLEEVFGISDVVILGVMAAGIALTPLVALIAWKYDIVPPQLVRDTKDLLLENPGLGWARLRHDSKESGYLLLAWVDGDGARHEKRFFQPVGIGREASNDIEFSDERVSRHHAVLWAEEGLWHVRDLDSANGTYVGHVRVSGTADIPASCELRFHINGPMVSVRVAKTAATRVG